MNHHCQKAPIPCPLSQRVLDAIRAADTASDDAFDALALDLWRHQTAHSPTLAAWAARQPAPRHWRDIPALPQSAFKLARISIFPPEETPHFFLTSGTTGEQRGTHWFRDHSHYEAAILAGWDRLGLPRLRQLILAPRPRAATESSLGKMFAVLADQRSDGHHWLTTDAGLDFPAIFAGLKTAAAAAQPVAIHGTALGFLQLIEHPGFTPVALAPGSYLLETGGYKGTSRSLTKAALYAQLAAAFALPADAIWNEYGMTELSSQTYTHGLDRPHHAPPWMRVVVTDPETGAEVPEGETGTLRIFDLANFGSTLAIEVPDLAIRRGADFELLGRSPAALPRGCSRAV